MAMVIVAAASKQVSDFFIVVPREALREMSSSDPCSMISFNLAELSRQPRGSVTG
jgi:hypothetical protein